MFFLGFFFGGGILSANLIDGQKNILKTLSQLAKEKI